jgi:hypothetical protein
MSGGIIVLGMHRSGTSLISEMVHRWGAFGRIAECLPANQWNARGYWELAPLVDFNNRLLAAVGASWHCPPNERDNLRMAKMAGQPKYRDEALGLLASMQPTPGVSWFWKDPRLSLLLPFWQQLWGEVRFVVCLRDPLEICRSLGERDDLSFDVSIVLWQRYMLAILEAMRKAPAIFMSYSALLRNPAGECRRLARFLEGSSELASSNSAAGAMREVVDRGLRHYGTNARLGQLRLSESQIALQELLERLGRCGAMREEPNLSRYALPRFWRSVLQANLLLRRCWRRWNRVFQTLPATPSQLASTRVLNDLSQAMALGTLEVSSSLTDSGYMAATFSKLAREHFAE